MEPDVIAAAGQALHLAFRVLVRHCRWPAVGITQKHSELEGNVFAAVVRVKLCKKHLIDLLEHKIAVNYPGIVSEIKPVTAVNVVDRVADDPRFYRI